MSTTGSGSLGQIQLMAFVTAGHADAARDAAKTLGFSQVQIETGDAVTAAGYLKQNPSPEVLLIEVGSAEVAPAQLDALADVVNPQTKVLVTGTIDSYRFYHWLMDLGIHEYVLQPFTAEQLKQSIIKGQAKKTLSHQEGPRLQKLVALIGARGGVGTSTLATNLAALLAREHHQPTALIDLDPYFGTIALGLDLEPVRGMRDALEKPDRVDAMFLERVMVKPFAPLSILSAEEPLQEIINAQANAGEMIFAALREKFNVVVVDLPRQMNPLTRYVLAHADTVLIVADPQLADLRDALRLKDYLTEQLKRPAPQVVLNRVGLAAKQELPAGDFKKHFGAAPAMKLGYLPDAFAASAQGELLIDHPKLKTALAPLRALAATIVGAEPETETAGKPGGSVLGRWKKGQA